MRTIGSFSTVQLPSRVALQLFRLAIEHARIVAIFQDQRPHQQAVYNSTKAFIDSFAIAMRHELKDSGVSVTVLMPGATQTRFFERADMMDTEVGTQEKDNPADAARDGYDAVMAGEEQVVSGWKNKMQVAAAHVTPAGTLAEQHRDMAEPGSAKNG
jgi:short-subunit dehydrogenase